MNSLQAVGWPMANIELGNVWSNSKFPMFNIEALLEVHRKNAAAWTHANNAVFDGVKSFAQCERDLLKSTVDDYLTVTSNVLTGASVQERTTKQVESAGRIYTSSVAHFLELSNIAVKTNVSAVDILNARFTELFDEFTSLFNGRRTIASSAEPTTAEPVASVEEVALIEDAIAALPSTATDTPNSAPRTARSAKATKPSKSASKAASKMTTRTAKTTRRGTSRKG